MNNEEDIICNTIPYTLSLEQAERICRYYNKDISVVEEYEICELLDRYIDEMEQ